MANNSMFYKAAVAAAALVEPVIKGARIISLGGNCSVAIWHRSLYTQPTHFFDWIGTPSWAIKEILTPGPTFKSIFKKDKNYNIIPQGSPESFKFSFTGIRIHEHFLLTFPHENDKSVNELADIYDRRLDRFYKDILYNKHGLNFFIRFELNNKNWLNLELNPFFAAKLPATKETFNAEKHIIEKQDMQLLCDHLKAHFPCKFKIIYLSQYLNQPFTYNTGDDIIFIKLPPFDVNVKDDWKVFANLIHDAIFLHKNKLEHIVSTV